jgi:hypothetical protein
MNATKSDFGEPNKIGYDDREPASSASSHAPSSVDRFALWSRAMHTFLNLPSLVCVMVEAEASPIRDMNDAAPR